MKRFYVAATLLCTLLLASLTVLAQAQSAQEKNAAAAKRAEFKKKAQTLVASKEERAKYADFLKAPNTGLIRLLPRERYITESYAEATGKSAAPAATANVGSFSRKKAEDVSSTGTSSEPNPPALTNLDDVPRLDSVRPANNRGGARDGGAYYSFTLLTHAYGHGSDLALERGQFGVGFAGADYGFITNLGDVPLESISLDTPEAKRLAAYPRARQESDARREYYRFQQGAEIDGVKVKSRLPMRLNSTYLLRAINYAETDVLVAFKVVEIDAEGTPVILWKLLKRYSIPQRVW